MLYIPNSEFTQSSQTSRYFPKGYIYCKTTIVHVGFNFTNSRILKANLILVKLYCLTVYKLAIKCDIYQDVYYQHTRSMFSLSNLYTSFILFFTAFSGFFVFTFVKEVARCSACAYGEFSPLVPKKSFSPLSYLFHLCISMLILIPN